MSDDQLNAEGEFGSPLNAEGEFGSPLNAEGEFGSPLNAEGEFGSPLPELTAEQIQQIAMGTGCDSEVHEVEGSAGTSHAIARWEGDGGAVSSDQVDDSLQTIAAGSSAGLTEDDRPTLERGVVPGSYLTFDEINACFVALNAPNGFYEKYGIVAQRLAEDQVLLSIARPDPKGGGVGHFRWQVKLPALLPVAAIELRGTAEADITAFDVAEPHCGQHGCE